MKILLYCTKGKPYLLREDIDEDLVFFGINKIDITGNILNGEIVAECDYEVEDIELNEYDDYNYSIYSKTYYETKTLQEDDLCKQSCLTADELDEYLCNKSGKAIHIKNLHIFDKPRELREYLTCDGNYEINNFHAITNAPQNMMYAFKCNFKPLCFATLIYDYKLEKNILISIRPEWLCKILNGEKTIEVRKKVLKEMEK